MEMGMIGDYPIEGWRFWAFIAGTVAVELFGVVLMFAMGSHG
jgi:hypothetical protein